MDPRMSALVDKISALEFELEAELASRRAALGVGLDRGRIVFDKEDLRRHRELRTNFLTHIFSAHPLVILTSPVIYAMVIPIALMDVFISVYQAICFPVYGIPRVRRRDFIVLDRHHLAYLNAIEKVNCVFCSYANGVIAYAREIGARTEQYFCPIKHARRATGTHSRYVLFDDYGNGEGYQQRLKELRESLAREGTPLG